MLCLWFIWCQTARVEHRRLANLDSGGPAFVIVCIRPPTSFQECSPQSAPRQPRNGGLVVQSNKRCYDLIGFWAVTLLAIMRLGSLNIAVRTVLSATLLLASGGAPTLEHSHAGGENQHDHAALAEHSHDHGHDGTHGHENPTATTGISNSVCHVHVSLLGVNFTFPSSPGPNESKSDSGKQTAVIAGVVGASMPPVQVRTAFDFAPLGTRLDYYRPVLPVAPRFSCIPAISAPLCDTARHERSGVQLI